MRKALLFFAAAGIAASVYCQDKPAQVVACQGTVIPVSRVARLAAYNPAGAAAVIEKVFVKKGDAVEAGSPVALIKGAARAEASAMRAQAAYENAKTAADLKILQQKNLISDLEGTYAQNESVLKEKSPPRREAEQIAYEQEALLRHIAQARAILPLVEANAKAMALEAEAAAKEARALLEEYTVRASISGKVIDVYAKEGEAVNPDGVCEIADTSKMYAEAEIYFSDVLKVKTGDKAEITSDALKGKILEGVVTEISRQVRSNRIYPQDPGEYSDTRVVLAKIELKNPEDVKNLIGSQVAIRIFTNAQ